MFNCFEIIKVEASVLLKYNVFFVKFY